MWPEDYLGFVICTQGLYIPTIIYDEHSYVDRHRDNNSSYGSYFSHCGCPTGSDSTTSVTAQTSQIGGWQVALWAEVGVAALSAAYLFAVIVFK
jgi:hypothetical protein